MVTNSERVGAFGGRSGRAGSYPKGRGRRSLAGLLPLLLMAPLLFLASSCKTTPVTGRRSFNLFSTGQELEMGRSAFAQVKSQGKIVTGGRDRAMVERVMNRIVAVADDAGFEWEVELLEDNATVNAFALPGGKMAVYTGILPICQDDAGLAVVIGHEIGHVVASHGSERVTHGLGADLIVQLLQLGDYTALGQAALEVGALRPFGRTQESEADEIGLIYMARAGYDPREAVAFWGRMNELSQGGGPPEFLSTHPSHETRIARLEAKLPEALELYRQAAGR